MKKVYFELDIGENKNVLINLSKKENRIVLIF
jgi:hypothetical protein